MISKKQGLALSFVCAVSLHAVEAQLGTIDVEAKIDTEVVKDVHGDEIKSADLAEALFKQSPSVTLVRRSGVANDIIVRGQKKDNINVTIDGAKLYGACPNRMDPPVSHVLTNNIDYIEINEGPYNVEDFGVLSADVKIHTLKPTKQWHGDVSLNAGNWGYQKGAFSLSGGTERVRVLFSASTEKSGQYEDGNGRDFAQQQDAYIATHPKSKGMAYKPQYRGLDAFSKKTFMGKLFWDITDTQSVSFGYTQDKSDDVLYPNTPMDADYDKGEIYTFNYTLKALGRYAKKLTLDLYQSEVDHPMSNRYRRSTAKSMGSSTLGVIKHQLSTKMQGAKLKNALTVDNHNITIGIDYSKRNWDGAYWRNEKPFPNASHPNFHSIWDAQTKNIALFVADKVSFERVDLKAGLRYDDTTVSTARPGVLDNSYNALNGNLFATYHVNENLNCFAGVGIASRVPDGKELYFHTKGKTGHMAGNPDLNKVVNREVDIGVDAAYDNATFKAKLFYSNLKDDILYNATTQRYENSDAAIWGAEVSGSYALSESLYIDYGAAYQRGKKKDPLSGQSDTNLPEIPPLKANVALHYDWDETLALSTELIASAKWSDYDVDNGEQALDGYAVVNLKGTKAFAKHFEVTVGIDNLFDKTYALSNTYKDLTLIAGGDEVMLMNEAGRYLYANVRYRF